MNPDSDIPPIASPHGAGTVNPQRQPQPDPIQIRGKLRWGALGRYALLEWVTPTLPLMLVLLPLWLGAFLREVRTLSLALLLATVFLSTLTRLFSRRRFDIEISVAGITKRTSRRTIFYSWSKFFWIIERGGDLWLASISSGCFIPREAFASREESHELALFVRELKRSDGAAWRPEWNGRTFGVQNE